MLLVIVRRIVIASGYPVVLVLPRPACEATREFSLASLGKRFVQHPGNGKTQDAVAEKFEPLIGFVLASCRRANMGQRRRD